MKYAVLTGAGSGLGRELALVLAREGFRTLLADINSPGALETLDMVRRSGGEGEVIEVDVTKRESVETMARYAFDSFGRVDLLVNNAGVTCAGFTGDIPLENWEWCMNVDLWGMIYGCHYFIPGMKAQGGGGHIVNVSSSAGIMCLPEMGPYNVAKAGVVALSETIRGELAPHGIGVTVVCPTFFRTNLLESMRYQDEFQKSFARTTFDNGRMSAADIAEDILKAVKKNRLYAVPQFSGKLFWFNKRMAPETYNRVVAFTMRKKFGERLVLVLARWGLL